MSRETEHLHEIAASLARWYEANRRSLPWRQTRDPYRIWLSEVILQQTRVAQGTDYYLRFTQRFPDVLSLAAAPEDEVMKLWQGLGYYSRARNLHAAARQVAAEFGGIFPGTYAEVRSLKGVGDYTAAAVCSIAFGLPHAAVDGNVYRVLSRLFDLGLPVDGTEGKARFAELARLLLDRLDPGLHNQAMMEFGAILCTPKNPDCTQCPLAERCLALAHGTVAERPVKGRKTAPSPRWFNYLHIDWQDRTLLRRRQDKDIWRNLWEFPLIETPGPARWEEITQTELFRKWFSPQGVRPRPDSPPQKQATPGGKGPSRAGENESSATAVADGPHVSPSFRLTLLGETAMPPHQLSHRTIHARFYRLRLEAEHLPAALSEYTATDPAALGDYAVCRLLERYLEREPAKK